MTADVADRDDLIAAMGAHGAVLHTLGYSHVCVMQALDSLIAARRVEGAEVRAFTAWALRAGKAHPELNLAALPLAGHLIPRTDAQAVLTMLYGSVVENLSPNTVMDPLRFRDGDWTSRDDDGPERLVIDPSMCSVLIDALGPLCDEFADSLVTVDSRTESARRADEAERVWVRALIAATMLRTGSVMRTCARICEPLAGSTSLASLPHYLVMELVGDPVSETILATVYGDTSEQRVLRKAALTWLEVGRNAVYRA